jgi:hypothetical protein
MVEQEDTFEKQFEDIIKQQSKKAENIDKIPQIPIENYNLSNGTRWVFIIPFGLLFNKLDSHGKLIEVPLNCKALDFPNFQLGNTSVYHQGYEVPVSTRINNTEKTLVVRFNPSSNWLQYLILLKWFEMEDYTNYQTDKSLQSSVNLGSNFYVPSYDKTDASFVTTQGPTVPTQLLLMDNFYNKIVTINFTGSWLTQLNRVTLDYEKTDKTEIMGEFSLKFYKYDIDVQDINLQKFIDDKI